MNTNRNCRGSNHHGQYFRNRMIKHLDRISNHETCMIKTWNEKIWLHQIIWSYWLMPVIPHVRTWWQDENTGASPTFKVECRPDSRRSISASSTEIARWWMDPVNWFRPQLPILTDWTLVQITWAGGECVYGAHFLHSRVHPSPTAHS